MSKKVIILGASRYYSKSIEAAQKAGYYVIALDKNPEAVGLSQADKGIVCDIADKESVLDVARNYAVNGIIPLNDIGVPVAAYVAEKLRLPGISSEAAELATNKELMRKRWQERRIPCPKVFVAVTDEDFQKGFHEVGFPCILKPAHGLGGASRGVIVVNSTEEAAKAIDFSQKFYNDKTVLIESFVNSIAEHSAEVLVHNGEYSIIAISDKVKTALPYRVDKNVLYPTAIIGKRLEDLKQCIIESVKALDIHIGAVHVEIATTDKGPVLFELGARCGGGGTPSPIVPFVTGIDYFVEIVKVLSGDKPGQTVPLHNKGCNYHFITPSPGTARKINGIDKLTSSNALLDFDLFIKPGDVVKQVQTGLDRSGFIIVGAETAKEAFHIGNMLESLIQIEYED